jgi:hypothetical protein
VWQVIAESRESELIVMVQEEAEGSGKARNSAESCGFSGKNARSHRCMRFAMGSDK